MTVAMVAASISARFINEVARSTSSESTASKKSSTFPMAASFSRTSVPSKSVSSVGHLDGRVTRRDPHTLAACPIGARRIEVN
jgi:hypothetical protein